MDERDWLASRFEAARPHLRAVAYRMLGSYAEADDAVQETWLRLHRAEPDRVENLTGWLTTIVGRVCLDRLRSRQARREELVGERPADSMSTPSEDLDPEQHALLAETVGSALLVVLDSLGPTERVVFVLHDLFAVPFAEVATIVNRSPDAARQLAVAPDAGCRASPQPVAPIWLASARSSTPSSPRPATATSTHCSRCTTRMRASGPTTSPCASAPRPKPTAHRRLPEQPLAGPGARSPVSSTAPSDSSGHRGRTKIAFCFAFIDSRIAAINMIADAEQVRELDIALLDDGPPAARTSARLTRRLGTERRQAPRQSHLGPAIRLTCNERTSHSDQEASMGEQVVMSLGVEDLEPAKTFYADGLGFEKDQDQGFFVSFKHDDRGPTVGLYTGDPFKYDASLVTEGGGHRGVTLSRVVETAERVDELMAQAAAAGAKILEPAHTAAWGGYIGYFTDPDGNLWKVVVGQSE